MQLGGDARHVGGVASKGQIVDACNGGQAARKASHLASQQRLVASQPHALGAEAGKGADHALDFVKVS